MQIITLALLFIAAIILAITWWKSYRDMIHIEQIVSEAREKGHTVRIGCIEKGVILNEADEFCDKLDLSIKKVIDEEFEQVRNSIRAMDPNRSEEVL